MTIKHYSTILVWLSVFSVAICPSGINPKKSDTQNTRLRVRNGCREDLWIFWLNSPGGGTSITPNKNRLSGLNSFVDVQVPDEGLAGTRFWPGYNCDEKGNNCQIGASGGPAALGFECPTDGCAPPVDSKFEGTFGCLPTVDPSNCQVNPSDTSKKLPGTDSWDTSMVDGYTLPYIVKVLDDCPGGPKNNLIDCSNISLSVCPENEDLSSGGVYPEYNDLDMMVINPTSGDRAGCYSDCGRLTYNNWGMGPGFNPTDIPAIDYCCPSSEISPDNCRKGFVAKTDYVSLIHDICPQVYAYSYDETNVNGALWSCPAGTRYEVTFYCPNL